jgi:hypothetical protein
LDLKKRELVIFNYFLKTTNSTPTKAPTTTIQPAIIVIIAGIPGIINVSSIIPKPTANETKTPTIQLKIPTIELSVIFYLLSDLFSSLQNNKKIIAAANIL